jgi:phenylacetate-CoA ligase
MQQLYLSANHISEKNAPAFVDALHRYKITHIIAYTSSATFLAHQMLQLGLQPPATLKVILTNAEPLFDWQRQTLQEGFKCAVRETYGMAEIVTAASADQQNRLRLWLDCGLSEVLKQDTDQPGLVGETGRLVGTGLLNADMPLIRYEVGDLINLLPESPPPQDTIQLPFVGDVQGRISDMLVAEDGRRVFWLNPVFYGLPITEAQIMQEQLGEVQVNYVPGITFASDDAQKIVERIRERLGASTKVTLTSMAAIPRGANNKFQPVICRLSQQLGEKLP